jgi:hypothetical protein
MEGYRGRLIAYSLGTFASWRGIALGGPRSVTMVLEVELDARGNLLRGRIHPARQRPPGGVENDPSGAAIAEVRVLSSADFGDDAVRIADDGALTLPSR